MAESGSNALKVAVVSGVFAVLASPIWGPPICRAVGVCDPPQPTPSPTPQPTANPVPNSSDPRVETSVFLSQTSGPAGSQVKVSGQGFAPGETVVIEMQTTEIGRTTANNAGSFSGVEVTIPQQFSVFAPRQFAVKAMGASSLLFSSAPFTVSG